MADVGNFRVPSLKLTWHLKITPWTRRFLLETIIFRCYVSFRECISINKYLHTHTHFLRCVHFVHDIRITLGHSVWMRLDAFGCFISCRYWLAGWMSSNLKIKQTCVSKVKSHRFLCNPYQVSMSWCNCSNRVLTDAHNINSHKRQRSFSGLFATKTNFCQVKAPNIIIILIITSSGTEKFHRGFGIM